MAALQENLQYDDKSLYEALKELGVIDPKVLYQKFEEARTKKVSFQKVLLDADLIADANLGKVISDLIKVPLVRLSEIFIQREVLELLPEITAKNYKTIAFKRDDKGISIATATPWNTEIRDLLAKKTGLPVYVYFATEADIEETLIKYSSDIAKAFEDIITENIKLAKGKESPEVPIAKIIDTLITYAYNNKASDVHIEPLEQMTLVRYRVDGILHDVVSLPKDILAQIVNRVKVLSKLRTDEHASAQDGKMQFRTPEENLDIRVSIVPVVHGEKVVLRLLSEKSRQFGLADLGLTGEDLTKVQEAYKKPHGMVLATGPTGCGKTTTLYAILKILNKRGVNIMTIEDPIEYEIQGINQIQVNPQTNLTFAEGLKSIVRQDPDIIFVGEIRDAETSGIATNSALTGHLVLSSMHTNDAATTFPRLIDFGVEPFLVASTINVVIAQRLVRKICPSCRVSYSGNLSELKQSLSQEEMNKIQGESAELVMYKGKGCEVCYKTGYVGRVGIFEVLLVDEEIKDAIVAKKDASEIAQIAVRKGMRTMFLDGLEKVKTGVTTIEEVLRVTKD